MDYLLFLKLGSGLLGAIGASVFYWSKGYSKNLEKPTEDLDGNFLISKVGELEGLESDGVILAEPQPVVEPTLQSDPNSENPTITQ